MDYLKKAARVLDIEILELQRLRDRLSENFPHAVELIKDAVDKRGKVVVVGVGKSGHIGGKIASTLTSTGSPAVVLDSLNALHGDLGMVADGDAVLALSSSGETEELVRILPAIARLQVKIIAICGDSDSTLANKAYVVRDVLKAMASVRAGAAVVAGEDRQLLGIFTHGDFARHFQSDPKVGERLVADLMTLNPVTVHKDKLAVEVLKLLETHRIDDLVVVDDDKVPVGVVDSQDLTRLKLL